METNDLEIEAVVLGNGDFPTHPHPQTMLQQAPYVICCDGAADGYIQRGYTPDAIIGDGDSISEENRVKFNDIFHELADQETNDQTKAVNFLLEKGMKSIAIIGATGKREDHLLGNISLLIDYMRAGAKPVMMTNYGTFMPCHDTHTFRSFPGQQISIVLFGAKGLRGEGLAYPLSDFTNWWQGTLNEATGNSFTIHAEGDFLVFLSYPQA